MAQLHSSTSKSRSEKVSSEAYGQMANVVDYEVAMKREKNCHEVEVECDQKTAKGHSQSKDQLPPENHRPA